MARRRNRRSRHSRHCPGCLTNHVRPAWVCAPTCVLPTWLPSRTPAARHALRIVQEALTNARKHASSAPVYLRIEGAPGNGLTIEVRNPAPVLAAGRPKIPGSGAGLAGLAERAALSGGHLEHGLDENGEVRRR